jgi:hypothetical protein
VPDVQYNPVGTDATGPPRGYGKTHEDLPEGEGEWFHQMIRAVRCKACHKLLDTPVSDNTPYEGLYTCYNCDLYYDGTYWVPFEKADALVEKHDNDREFRIKPYMAKLHGGS